MNKKTIVWVMLVFVGLFQSSVNFAGLDSEKAYPLIWDRHLSPYVGVALSKSVASAYVTLIPYGDDQSAIFRPVNLWASTYVTWFTKLVNHEVFGHGFRFRELGVRNIHYDFSWRLSGTTFAYAPNLSLQQNLIVDIAGMEASDVLWRESNLNILKGNEIQLSDAQLSLAGASDQLEYVLTAKAKVDPWTGHDVHNYIRKLNTMYHNDRVSLGNLKNHTLLSLLDPFLYFSSYSILVNYLWNGKTHWVYPRFQLGEVQYLPGLKAIFTPYGPESQLNHYLKWKETSGQVSMNYGNNSGHQSYSLGVHVNMISLTDQIGIGGKVHIWHQPELFTNDPSLAKAKWGSLLSLKGEYRAVKNLSLYTELGYKTKGFVQGEILSAGAVARLGGKIFI